MTQNLEAIRRFLLAGMAIFTIVSKKSGDRKTFRVRAAEDVDGSGRPHGWYVDLLVGPNNTTDFKYLAYLYERANAYAFVDLLVKVNGKGWGEDAIGALVWLVGKINRRASTVAQIAFEHDAEFHHAGYCARCGRTLTDPESIELGIGPICREKS